MRKRIDSPTLNVAVSQIDLTAVEADLLAVGLYEGGELPAEIASAPGAANAKGGVQEAVANLSRGASAARSSSAWASARRSSAERARVAAALVAQEAGRLEASTLAWVLPESDDDAATAEGLVTCTILGAYRFDRFLSADPYRPSPHPGSSR